MRFTYDQMLGQRVSGLLQRVLLWDRFSFGTTIPLPSAGTIYPGLVKPVTQSRLAARMKSAVGRSDKSLWQPSIQYPFSITNQSIYSSSRASLNHPNWHDASIQLGNFNFSFQRQSLHHLQIPTNPNLSLDKGITPEQYWRIMFELIHPSRPFPHPLQTQHFSPLA